MYAYHPMSTPNHRKRPAPGSLPMPQQMPPAYNNPPDQLPRWNGNNAGGFVDNTSSNANPYGMMASPTQPHFNNPGPSPTSNALARRGMNNALVTANRAFTPVSNDGWPSYLDENNAPTQANGVLDENDNIELLEEKAQRAKREAQAKRKQIPPFVQKLNSFLEESRNTDLIRWSEKGDSFIVLDEDEFAKTLIPELFKHNNYASFVRQLNMYGFHKKVGLSDNSMKASERKNKSPSEYYNPYFKRGHPNLLWLINKPKGTSSKKGPRKRGDEGENESDEDVIPVEGMNPAYTVQTPSNRALPAPEPGPLERKELAVVRDQMATLQQRQKQISDAITRIRQEHNQLYQQALMFQNMHDRHENSINAILNFLANVFRKSLEEQGGVQNVNDLLASIIPNMQMPNAGSGGSVVDLGDWQHTPAAEMAAGTPKRHQRLLPPIPEGQAARPSTANTSTPSSEQTYAHHHQQPHAGQVTEVFDTPTESGNSPSYFKQELESNPQESMMKIIQDTNTNARNSAASAMNLPNLPNLPSVAAATSPTLTDDQRNRMLSIMSGGGQSNASTSGPAATTPTAAAPTPRNSTAPQSKAMSRSPSRSTIPLANAPPSLSPIMPTAVPPSIQRISQTDEELEQLQRLQEEQSQKLEDLNNLLGPLSPSGRIPGLDDSNPYFGDDIDLSQYLDPTAYSVDGTGNDFNFDPSSLNDTTNLDWHPGIADFGTGAVDGGLGVDSSSPNHQSPSTTGTEEIPRDDLEDSPGRAAKRQRRT